MKYYISYKVTSTTISQEDLGGRYYSFGALPPYAVRGHAHISPKSTGLGLLLLFFCIFTLRGQFTLGNSNHL